MTVRDFAGLCSDSVILHISTADTNIMYFDSRYWEYITDDVLDLEIESFSINNRLMKKAEVFITVAGAVAETEPGPEDSPEGEDPDDEVSGSGESDDPENEP